MGPQKWREGHITIFLISLGSGTINVEAKALICELSFKLGVNTMGMHVWICRIMCINGIMNEFSVPRIILNKQVRSIVGTMYPL